jgi:N-acetylglutamate synthase-like GNAT family acetyltransferase
MEKITIQPYNRQYQRGIIALILAIQRQEFGIEIHLADQPDLEHIETYYQTGKGNFWTAIINNSVIGTIALLDIGNNKGALRKMFVKTGYRGKELGVGQSLLNTLLQWAAGKQFEKILLGTTEKFIAAQRFYEKNNFIEIDKNVLPPEFPVMKVDVKFYEYIL